jgi:hypothetical protein
MALQHIFCGNTGCKEQISVIKSNQRIKYEEEYDEKVDFDFRSVAVLDRMRSRGQQHRQRP